jgi:hypothetical protein
MFYCNINGQYINEGTQFEIEGVTYPPQWLNQSTPEQKAEIGLEEVIATNEPYNPIYYWTGEILEAATLTYTGTARDLIEVQSTAITSINNIAYSLLLPSDWMVVKSVETGINISNNWNVWRTSIRNTATSINTQLKLTASVDEVEAIMYSINWPSMPI